MQLLCPELHAIDVNATPAASTSTLAPDPALGDRVSALESEVANLREKLRKLAESLGVHDETAA